MKTSNSQGEEAGAPAMGGLGLVIAVVFAIALIVLYGAYSEGVVTKLFSGEGTEAKLESGEGVSTAIEQAPSLDQSIQKLSSRLAANPNDLEGWVLLGNSYMVMGQYDLAMQSFGEAKRLSPKNPDILVSFGETLVLANGGKVTSQANTEFDAALKVAPEHPVARYYLALSAYQDGESAKAIAMWKELLGEAPTDAPWREAVQMRLSEAGVQFEDSQAAAEIAKAPGEDQAAMIEAMVAGLADRLEGDPSDLQGWRMLARSYSTLGRAEEGLDRLKAAINEQEENAKLRRDLEQLALEIYGEGAID